MDLVRNRDIMSYVRIIFWSVAAGYVIATDLQGFIPESYLSLLTLTAGSWEQNPWHLLLLPSFFLLVLGWILLLLFFAFYLITHYASYLAAQARLFFKSHLFLFVL